jgi:hypothetical protein
VFIFSKACWAFSWASLNLASTSFISGYYTKSVQICMLSSQSLVCWITERGGESVIEKFNHIIQVLYQ